MRGMVMAFTIKDDWGFDVLTPGDQITATLVVDGPATWLEDVVMTEEGSNSEASAAGEPGEAKPGDAVPQFELVNQDGKKIKLGDFRGKTLALTFIYTRCPIPEYCTLMSNNFALMDQQLQKQPELYAKTHLLSVSIDPTYDQPAVLRSYGAAHTGKYSEEQFEHWDFASGDQDQINGLAQFFRIRHF